MSAPDGTHVAQPFRLGTGGLIDRNQPIGFEFDGRALTGYAGDSLASALLAAGQRMVARSFKYHRPRGILSAGSEEPNALVELRNGARHEPNTRATVIELYEGLVAHSQNRWPTLSFDLGAINSAFSALFVAGFYYKTFMWPAAFWEKVYEPLIRRAAGLGRPGAGPDPDCYDKQNAFCDVLVIGGGPAGLAAALTAGRAGARVILCEEDHLFGGRLNSERRCVAGMAGHAWALEVTRELESLPQVQLLPRTCVFGAYDGGMFGAVERLADHKALALPHEPRQRLWRIVAKHTVLAAGALERPMVFGGNDLPGVMLASAVRTYANRYGVAPGRRLVVATATDEGWRTAFDLHEAGVAIEAIADSRVRVGEPLLARAKQIPARVLLDTHVASVRGRRSVQSVQLRVGAHETLDLAADALAMSGGYSPSLALSTHLGARPRWDEAIAAFVPGEARDKMIVVGAAAGTLSLEGALREGATAGEAVNASLGLGRGGWSMPEVEWEATDLSPTVRSVPGKGKAFVDFQHDVTREDLALGVREGFTSPELLKRYTTLGMATDQGKTSSLNGHAILAELTQRAPAAVGTTVFRPPYVPVSLSVLAGRHRGRHFRPTRRTAGHAWAQANGASFTEAGLWLRAQWFTQPGETDWLQSATREARAVRSDVGICDVSTLGKIEIRGRDAAAFLDFLYINDFSTLPAGRVRYGVMLREDGFVMDDGTTAHLGSHYLMTTTTANAGAVMQHMEYARQVLWPQLDVQLASVSEQWAQYSIAGPNARKLLQEVLGTALDVSNEAFPYLACREFAWRGVRARLFRVSFSGELAYELAVPASCGDSALRHLVEAGEPFGLVPYGLEALGMLRIEKGHVAGAELNGMTTAADLGFARMMSPRKDFIGRVLACRPALQDPERPVLVGIKPVERDARLNAGAHFLSLGAKPSLEHDEGYVTSTAFSPYLEQWIGLGLLERGRERHGERILAYDALRGNDRVVEVVAPVFYDPRSLRTRD